VFMLSLARFTGKSTSLYVAMVINHM